jgi:hypothetical protein
LTIRAAARACADQPDLPIGMSNCSTALHAEGRRYRGRPGSRRLSTILFFAVGKIEASPLDPKSNWEEPEKFREFFSFATRARIAQQLRLGKREQIEQVMDVDVPDAVRGNCGTNIFSLPEQESASIRAVDVKLCYENHEH